MAIVDAKKKKTTQLEGTNESLMGEIEPMNFVIFIIMIVIIAIVYFTQLKDDSDKPKTNNKNNDKFLIPKKGGALQLMAKD